MAALVVLLAGCTAAKSAGAAMRPVSLRGPITFATGTLGTGYLPGLVAQWNAGHPRQRVTVIYLPADADVQHAQLVENLQARSDVYDVMNLDVIMAGYAGQFAAYEGLTVNFAEAVQSAGGSILSQSGSQATLTSPQARHALGFLVGGFRRGWIPRAALGWDEEASRRAFEAGKLLFLRNWPYVYADAATPGPGNKVAGKFGVTTLPGPHGPGSSSLGGGNLAVSAFSQHPGTALAFIRFLTSLPSERRALIDTSLPPVWTRLYTEPALIRRFPYLPVLKKAILAARPRPEIAGYNQLSLDISSAVHRALAQQVPVTQTLTSLNTLLIQIVRKS